ncbi:MAG TPA: endolytic transglycosylase MltG [bacterium]|nr:endolytic transglycosylase MltG [bacterium]
MSPRRSTPRGGPERPEPPPAPRRSKASRIVVSACAVLGLALAGALWAPAYPSKSVVSVPLGAGLGTVAARLRNAGAVHSAFVFKCLARLEGHSGDIKAGDYEIPKGMNAFQTLGLLVSGRSLMHPLLVPEGMSAAQIGAEMEKQGLGTAKAFMALVKDPAAAKRYGVPGPTLEGYLFPDTYFLPRGVGEATAVRLMVERFHQKVPDALLEQGRAIRLSPRQVMTMASIIEKEAKLETERPMISAVFRNRMRLKKRLESCATVRYALNKWAGPLYDKDLLAASPYNTYRNFGLPPGPICSPGLPSIEAALRPAKTDALFFVVAGDGSHVFSKDYAAHLKAKARWKRLKKGMVEASPPA